MKEAHLTQFLIDITRGSLKQAFAANRDEVLAASQLSEPMREAIRAQDIASLWLAGAHPMALMYFARGAGYDNERYYGCIAEAELRKADRAGSTRSTAPGPQQTRQ